MSVSRYLPLARGILLGAALAMASTAALAQKREFSFAYDQPKNSGYGIGAEMFNKKLGELSKGTLSINQYPGAQLGTEAQTLQKVQTGDIDFVMLSTANASTAQPESGVFSIHFIFRDEAHAIKVLGDPAVIAAMKELYAAKMKGAHMLGLGSQGLRHMYGKKAVEKVADIKGLKVRVQATVTEDTLFPAYGAQVVHMPFGEVYTSLQTGVADGQMNPIPIIAFAKFDEVQKYLSITNHVITPYFWLINAKFYAGLTADEKKLVDGAAEVAVEAGRGISRIIEASTEKGLPKLGKKMTINAVPPAELKKFAAVAQPAVRKVIEEQLGAEGVAMLNAMLADIDKAAK